MQINVCRRIEALRFELQFSKNYGAVYYYSTRIIQIPQFLRLLFGETHLHDSDLRLVQGPGFIKVINY